MLGRWNRAWASLERMLVYYCLENTPISLKGVAKTLISVSIFWRTLNVQTWPQ